VASRSSQRFFFSITSESSALDARLENLPNILRLEQTKCKKVLKESKCQWMFDCWTTCSSFHAAELFFHESFSSSRDSWGALRTRKLSHEWIAGAATTTSIKHLEERNQNYCWAPHKAIQMMIWKFLSCSSRRAIAVGGKFQQNFMLTHLKESR
jgi:hypothetical protein